MATCQQGSIQYKTIFAVGLTLFVLTLAMNLIAIRLVRKYRGGVRVIAEAPQRGRWAGLVFQLLPGVSPWRSVRDPH